MSDHAPIPDDELISALHDGELNASDRARAEQLLAADPERQRELAELRKLSGDLHSLPRRRLPASFADGVLQRIEQEKLWPSEAAAANAQDDGESRRVGLRLPRGRRPWVWAGLAIAAGLVVMVVGNRLEDGRLVVLVEPKNVQAPALDAARNRKFGEVETEAVTALDRDARRADEMGRGEATRLPTLATDAVTWNEDDMAERLNEYGYTPPVSRLLAKQAANIDSLSAVTADDSVLVIEVEVDRKQLESDPFATVLLDNGIAGADVPQTQVAQLRNNLARPQDYYQARGVTAPGSNSDNVDLVYVVASPQQVAQAVNQMQAQSNTYRRMLVRNDLTANERRKLLDLKGENSVTRQSVPAAKQDLQTAEKSATTAGENTTRSKELIAGNKQPSELNQPAAGPQPDASLKAQSPREGIAKKMGENLIQQRGWFARLEFPTSQSGEVLKLNRYSATMPAPLSSAPVITPSSAPPAGVPQSATMPLPPKVASQPALPAAQTEPKPMAKSPPPLTGAAPNAPAPAAEAAASKSEASKGGEAKDGTAKDKIVDQPMPKLSMPGNADAPPSQPHGGNQRQAGGFAGGGGNVQLGLNESPPLQRALFVFRVVDTPAPASASTSSPPATAAPAPATPAPKSIAPASPAPTSPPTNGPTPSKPVSPPEKKP